MNVNEAIRIMRARAPVVTCGAATIWKIGNIRFKCIEAVTHTVSENGKYYITVTCRDSQAQDSRTVLGLDDVELAPDCPEILRKMIYKDGPAPSEKNPAGKGSRTKRDKRKSPAGASVYIYHPQRQELLRHTH